MNDQIRHVTRILFRFILSVWALGVVNAQSTETSVVLRILGEAPEYKSLPGHTAENSSYSGYQWVRVHDLRRDLGQSVFMPENADVSAISFLSHGNVQPEAYDENFQLEIWESDRVDRLGERLRTWEGMWFPQGTFTADKWIRFAFPAVPLQKGYHYTFMLRWRNQGPRHVFRLAADAEFNGGRRWQSGDGEAHTSTSSHTLFFQLEPAGE